VKLQQHPVYYTKTDYATQSQHTLVTSLLYITQKLCGVVVMTVWQFRAVTAVWMFFMTCIQAHYAVITAILCVLLCSSRVRNRLRLLPQQLPDMIYAVLPGDNMKERGMLQPIPYISQRVFTTAICVSIAEVCSGVTVSDMHDMHRSFTTFLMIIEMLVVYFRNNHTPNMTVYRKVAAAVSIYGIVYMLLYFAQQAVVQRDWRYEQLKYDSLASVWYYVKWRASWYFILSWSVVSRSIRYIIGTEVFCIMALVLCKCCSLVARQPVHVLQIIKDASYRMLNKGIAIKSSICIHR
jgi:hypothetical protein